MAAVAAAEVAAAHQAIDDVRSAHAAELDGAEETQGEGASELLQLLPVPRLRELPGRRKRCSSDAGVKVTDGVARDGGVESGVEADGAWPLAARLVLHEHLALLLLA